MGQAIIVVGLGFGDEGKGTIVDYLVREHQARTVVRFNGGAQAAHNVNTPDGKHHTFSQFGSGTLAGAQTHLSRFMLVNPLDFYNEAQHLYSLGIQDFWSRITFSPEALVTTPLHIAANQIREEMRKRPHGTCGKGIGETQSSAEAMGEAAIRIGDLKHIGVTESKLEQLSQYYTATLVETFPNEHGNIKKIAREYLNFAQKIHVVEDKMIREWVATGTVIFEGAQGILLDQDVGFHPHTTWSKTTSHNARELIGSGVAPTVIGVTRGYTTRHGLGPLIDESIEVEEAHNQHGGFQGRFRAGAWDALMMDYAAKCDPPDEVAVTHLDRVQKSRNWESVWSYNYGGDLPDLKPYFWADADNIYQINPGQGRAHSEAIARRLMDCKANTNKHHNVDADYVVDAIGEVLHAPVTIQSFGPAYTDKKVRVLEWAK